MGELRCPRSSPMHAPSQPAPCTQHAHACRHTLRISACPHAQACPLAARTTQAFRNLDFASSASSRADDSKRLHESAQADVSGPISGTGKGTKLPASDVSDSMDVRTEREWEPGGREEGVASNASVSLGVRTKGSGSQREGVVTGLCEGAEEGAASNASVSLGVRTKGSGSQGEGVVTGLCKGSEEGVASNASVSLGVRIMVGEP
eukprot:359633-Chlamydomonas_euryale.AAC.2